MSTDRDIGNMALYHLGEDPLTDAQWLANNARRSQIVQQFIQPSLDSFLKSYPWNNATVRTTWTADVAVPTWGYDHQFTVPADCLRILEVDGDPSFVREGNYILEDDASIDVLYVGRLTYDQLTAEQVLALATLLAANIAEPLTGKVDRVNALMQLYQQKMLVAQGVDGQEGTPPTEFSSILSQDR